MHSLGIIEGEGRTQDRVFAQVLIGAAADRQALCGEFLACLLSEESQGELHTIGAFSVTGVPSGYESGDPLAAMEVSLRVEGLAVPNSFDEDWAEDAENIVREFTSDSEEAPELWRRLRERMSKKTND